MKPFTLLTAILVAWILVPDTSGAAPEAAVYKSDVGASQLAANRSASQLLLSDPRLSDLQSLVTPVRSEVHCAAVGAVCKVGTFEADGIVHPSYERACCPGATCEVSQKTHYPGKASRYEYTCMKRE